MCFTMPFTLMCLALALSLIPKSFSSTNFKDDIFAKFDGDYEVASEKDEIEGFEYTLHNFTFSAFDVKGGGDDGHERVKRLQQPIAGNLAPLCIMTFNIRTYTAPALGVRGKDIVIARVSLLSAIPI